MRRFLNALIWVAVPTAIFGIATSNPFEPGPSSSDTPTVQDRRHIETCEICRNSGKPLPEVIDRGTLRFTNPHYDKAVAASEVARND